MNNPCDSCAFGQSGGAADEANNKLKGMICAFGGRVFWCHHGKDGAEYDWQNAPLGPLQLAPQNRKPCAGWQAEVRMLKAHGYFAPPFYGIRRIVAARAFGLLDRVIRKDIGRVKKREAWRELKRCIRFITTKDISNKVIPL